MKWGDSMAKNNFSFDIDNILKNSGKIKKEVNEIDNEQVNTAMNVANDIIDVFAKYNLELMDAYMILASLADAIYLYSATSEE